MKFVFAFCALVAASGVYAASHPFNVHDLVMMNRVSDPQLSPDGQHVLFSMRETDYAANKGTNGIWMLDLSAKDAKPVRMTDKDISASTPRWSAPTEWARAPSCAPWGAWRRAPTGPAPTRPTRRSSRASSARGCARRTQPLPKGQLSV